MYPGRFSRPEHSSPVTSPSNGAPRYSEQVSHRRADSTICVHSPSAPDSGDGSEAHQTNPMISPCNLSSQHSDEPFKRPKLPSVHTLLNSSQFPPSSSLSVSCSLTDGPLTSPSQSGPFQPGFQRHDATSPYKVTPLQPSPSIPSTTAPVLPVQRNANTASPESTSESHSVYGGTSNPCATQPNHHPAVHRYEPAESELSPSSELALATHPLGQTATTALGPKVRKRRESLPKGPYGMARCVGQVDVEGEGPCYVYEDGSYCRTIVGGEAVNPSWGLTKAGKPRKRLAQACLTCREKKIKCEPGFPKCRQCTKSQRQCRGGLNPAASDGSPVDGIGSTQSLLPRKRNSSDFLNSSVVAGSAEPRPRRLPCLQTPAVLEDHLPRSGNISCIVEEDGLPDTPNAMRLRQPGHIRHMIHPDNPVSDSRLTDHRALGWEQDPYTVDPAMTNYFLDLYFAHINSATYCIYPRRQFLQWVEDEKNKSVDDLMVLYSLLAMGSIFSTDPEKRAIGKQLHDIASYATEKRFGKFTLQLAQARLMVGLYAFARGKPTVAWDHCGSALRVVSALNLNRENEDPSDDEDIEYDYDPVTFQECRRRTFWAAYLMDRYNGFCGGTMCVIQPEDTFLRLPCKEEAYENSFAAETPFFDPELPQLYSGNCDFAGTMGQLVLISTIWGDVFSMASRLTQRKRSPDSYCLAYEAFRDRTCARLDAWMKQLPVHLHLNQENLEKSLRDGYAGSFISLHALCNAAAIWLNRNVRFSTFPPQNLVRNISQAVRFARQTVLMIQMLAQSTTTQPSGNHPSNFVTINKSPSPSTNGSPAEPFLFSTPFPGYAFTLAVDTLTAGGLISSLPSLIKVIGEGLTVVDDISTFWASAKAQHRAISGRLKTLTEIASDLSRKERRGDHWKMEEKLEALIGQEMDVIYGVEERVLWNELA